MCIRDSLCSLQYPKPYELLFSVRLAAQCTDERVNMVTPALFARFPTLESLAEADVTEVEEYIRSTGFFRAKARDIVAAARMLVDEYGGKVPDTMEEQMCIRDRACSPARSLWHKYAPPAGRPARPAGSPRRRPPGPGPGFA